MTTKYNIGDIVYIVKEEKSDKVKRNTFELYIQKLKIEKIEITPHKNCYGMVVGTEINYSFEEISEHYIEEELLETIEQAIDKITNLFE